MSQGLKTCIWGIGEIVRMCVWLSIYICLGTLFENKKNIYIYRLGITSELLVC